MIKEHIEARLQDYLEWQKQLKELKEQIKLKQTAASLIGNKLNETMKAISDLKKEESGYMAHYYYYELTSNSTFHVVKKEVPDIPEKIDIDNMAMNNYFFRKADAEKEGEKFIKVLEKSFKKKEVGDNGE